MEKVSGDSAGNRYFKVEYEKNRIFYGILLILTGLLLPLFLTLDHTKVLDMVAEYEQTGDTYLLLLSVLQLVVFNWVRALPQYMGVFFLSESISVTVRGKKEVLPNLLMAYVLLLAVYRFIRGIYQIKVDFGMTAGVILITMFFLLYLNLFSLPFYERAFIAVMIQNCGHWLDEIPYITKYGFGRGNISIQIKNAAEARGDERLLSLFSISMLAALFISVVILFVLLYKEHYLKVVTEKNKAITEELHVAQIEALQLRSSSEVENLVHDLKSPLTTVQGLVSLLELMEEDEQVQEYLDKISCSADDMSEMISDILYEDRRQQYTTENIFKTIFSQVYVVVPRECIDFENNVPKMQMCVNKIRFSRAIINLLKNAGKAIEDREDGKIEVSIQKKDGMIHIYIRDNGIGISETEIQQIWEKGYSTSLSTGLGLNFVKQVIENHEGKISVESQKNQYTEFEIIMKGEEIRDGKDNIDMGR